MEVLGDRKGDGHDEARALHAMRVGTEEQTLPVPASARLRPAPAERVLRRKEVLHSAVATTRPLRLAVARPLAPAHGQATEPLPRDVNRLRHRSLILQSSLIKRVASKQIVKVDPVSRHEFARIQIR